jgi:hypothetical protein
MMDIGALGSAITFVDPSGSTTPRRMLADVPHAGEKISANSGFLFHG